MLFYGPEPKRQLLVRKRVAIHRLGPRHQAACHRPHDNGLAACHPSPGLGRGKIGTAKDAAIRQRDLSRTIYALEMHRGFLVDLAGPWQITLNRA